MEIEEVPRTNLAHSARTTSSISQPKQLRGIKDPSSKTNRARKIENKSCEKKYLKSSLSIDNKKSHKPKVYQPLKAELAYIKKKLEDQKIDGPTYRNPNLMNSCEFTSAFKRPTEKVDPQTQSKDFQGVEKMSTDQKNWKSNMISQVNSATKRANPHMLSPKSPSVSLLQSKGCGND